MKRINHFVLAGLTALALLGGCDDHDHAHAPAAATQGASAAAPSHDDHAHHGHSHGDETRVPLGLEKAGPYEVAPVQLGKLKAGGQLAFDVEILGEGQAKPKAVRFWIGPESAEGTKKASPESEKDNVYHVDLNVPASPAAQMKFWVEVEPASGEPHRASFNLK